METHPNPKKSAVDPLQPLNFKEFSITLKKIKSLFLVKKKKELGKDILKVH
jgi:3-deoxy-D-manno-octulosonic acid (KDO) 8-phosphate synthase